MIKVQSALLSATAAFGLMAAYTVGPLHPPAPIIPSEGCDVPAGIAQGVAGQAEAALPVDFPLDEVRNGGAAPRVLVAAFPESGDDDPPEERKDAFLRGMVPMILAVNEKLMLQRNVLIRLAECEKDGAAFAPPARDWLAIMADQYGTTADPRALLAQVDVVPPSLALAQSALESGWGQSRFARERNALFGERRMGTDDSKPESATRLVGFERPIDAVIAYVDNLNTHPAYEEFRRVRASMLTLGMPLDPVRLTATLHRYSERRTRYVHDLRGLIASNSLTDFDTAKLETDDRQLAER
jgi:Bax protein